MLVVVVDMRVGRLNQFQSNGSHRLLLLSNLSSTCILFCMPNDKLGGATKKRLVAAGRSGDGGKRCARMTHPSCFFCGDCGFLDSRSVRGAREAANNNGGSDD